jgi:hypothetical protein
VRFCTARDAEDIRGGSNHSLGKEKPDRQVVVGAWCSHDHCKPFTVTLVYVGHMIFRKQVLRASHADGIRRERRGCSALRSVPAINDLP